MAKLWISVLTILCTVLTLKYAQAALTIPFTIALSEPVTVTGTPQIAVNVGGLTRYAIYSAGSGTNTLTFTLSPQAGDVDLDGITVASPLLLNGGTIKDIAGNDLAPLTFTPPNTSGVKINYPSLSMDFVYDADGRYTLNGTAYDNLTSFMAAAGGTFTRASIGTYYDSSGLLQTASANVPRFDWDPVTHAAKGILIEESRTNKTLYSQDFDNAYWATGTLISADTTIAPDGTLTADTLTQSSATNNDFIYDQTITAIANTTYTFSLFFKPGTRTTDFSVSLDWADFGSLRVTMIYTYATGITATSGSGVSRIRFATVQALANGWYRLALSFTTDTSVGHLVSMIGRYGTGPGTTFIWGAQMEQGANATSYIPTTAATVTRTADNFVIPTSGGWFDASTGGLFTQGAVSRLTNVTTRVFAALDDSTANNLMQLRINDADADQLGLGIAISGNSSRIQFGPYTVNSTSKLAFGYRNNDVNVSADGLIGSGAYSITVPSFSSLRVGASPATVPLNGWVEKVLYYPLRIPDAQLQLLTQ